MESFCGRANGALEGIGPRSARDAARGASAVFTMAPDCIHVLLEHLGGREMVVLKEWRAVLEL